MKILALVLRGFFAVLLLITAVTKLADFSGFVQIVASFDVLPAPLLVPAAWMLTLLELGLGLWLLSGWLLCGASIGLLALHSAYLLWLSAALLRGMEIQNCGCFGVYWARPLGIQTLVEEAVLLLLAVGLVVSCRRA